jgi:hypothetical protein
MQYNETMIHIGDDPMIAVFWLSVIFTILFIYLLR